MSIFTTTKHLEGLKHSLEAARDTKHPALDTLTGDCLERFESHIKGMRAGLQISIDAIDAELAMIRRWQDAGVAVNQ